MEDVSKKESYVRSFAASASRSAELGLAKACAVWRMLETESTSSHARRVRAEISDLIAVIQRPKLSAVDGAENVCGLDGYEGD